MCIRDRWYGGGCSPCGVSPGWYRLTSPPGARSSSASGGRARGAAAACPDPRMCRNLTRVVADEVIRRASPKYTCGEVLKDDGWLGRRRRVRLARLRRRGVLYSPDRG